jgi:enoyl-CoA hydratase/carnithine racemase
MLGCSENTNNCWPGSARELAFTATNFDAQRAKEINLVSGYDTYEDLLAGREMELRLQKTHHGGQASK